MISDVLPSYELNVAAKDSPLKIIRHYHPTTKADMQIDNSLKVINMQLYIIRDMFVHQHPCITHAIVVSVLIKINVYN